MKEATGELNMTVITVAAIALITTLFLTFVWPLVQARITTGTCQAAYGEDFTASKNDAKEWVCCNSQNVCHDAQK